VSPSFPFEAAPDEADPDRAARLVYASQKLGRVVMSWSSFEKKEGGLTKAEDGNLIHAMRADLGREREPRSLRSRTADHQSQASADALEIVGNLALDLYGSDWGEALNERLRERPFFHYGRLDQITPWQSHELIEILFDHLERKLNPEEATMEVRKQRKEELRARFVKKF